MYCVERVIDVPQPTLQLTGVVIVEKSHRTCKDAWDKCNLMVLKLLYDNDIIKDAAVEFQSFRQVVSLPFRLLGHGGIQVSL